MTTASRKKKLVIYSVPSSTSCRKTKVWLHENGIPFEERHLYKTPPSTAELLEFLKKSRDGMDEILAKRSFQFRGVEKEIEDMTVMELLSLLTHKPELLKRPIVTDGENVVVGYNSSAFKEYFG